MRVLIVDDDKNLRSGLKLSLESDDLQLDLVENFQAAMNKINDVIYDVLVFDIRLGELSGVELFEKIKKIGINSPVVFISSGASLSEVAEVMRLGAFDFLEKPFSNEKLLATLKNAYRINALESRIKLYEDTEIQKTSFIGRSKFYKQISRDIKKIAQTDATVLITGESGTGKEVLSREVYTQSKRSNKPYIKVNCSAIPDNLIESELFGHKKGAFTGAQFNKKGFFELADKGTIFLDEIGDMSLAAQAKILRVIQDSEIQSLGAEAIKKIDVRIICATNKNLEKGVQEGWFREDLYFRINVFPIQTKPLRERPEDIEVLFNQFFADFLKKNNLENKKIHYKIYGKLKDYQWPGNIRELKNLAERLAIVGGNVVTEKDLEGMILGSKLNINTESMSLKDFKEYAEREFILKALKKHGSISQAAEDLKIERTYLHKKISQHKITKKEYMV